MANTGLKIDSPKRNTKKVISNSQPEKSRGNKFDSVAEGDKVQFNRYVERQVADGYEMLAIKIRRKVPDLLSEGLSLLEEKYGKI